MWNFMDANPDVFTDSNAEGIERVQESGGMYAFFMESASIEYIMERHCELARVGRELDAKGYGIGELFYPSVEITTTTQFAAMSLAVVVQNPKVIQLQETR